MLLSLLYAGDAILAAAMAVDEQPFGWRYWTEIHHQPVPVNLVIGRDAHTAHAEIANEALAKKLLEMDFPSGTAAAHAVEEHMLGLQ